MSLPSEPVWPAVRAARSLVEQELINSLGWLISLRGWPARRLVATAVATRAWACRCRPPACIWSAAASSRTTGVLAVLRWLLRSRPDARGSSRRSPAQIALDWLAMACSSRAPAVPRAGDDLLPDHITIASLLLPHHQVSLRHAAPYGGGGALLEYAGVLQHVAIVQPGATASAVRERRARLLHDRVLRDAYSCMRIAHRLRRREAELSGLYEACATFTSTLEITTVLDRIVEAAARVLTCKLRHRLIDQSRSLVEFARAGPERDLSDEVPGEYAKSCSTRTRCAKA